jgi:hypothetical protein
MRGKKAKKLRKLAMSLLHKEGMSAGEGFNQYNQAMNRMEWEPQLDDDGLPLMDPEGQPLMKPGYAPGTLTTAWKFRTMYQNLKRIYKVAKRDSIPTVL